MPLVENPRNDEARTESDSNAHERILTNTARQVLLHGLDVLAAHVLRAGLESAARAAHRLRRLAGSTAALLERIRALVQLLARAVEAFRNALARLIETAVV